MKILLVEDDEHIQAWITATLKSNDHSIECFMLRTVA